MIDFIQMIVNGVATGSTYALMGLAMVIIYKTSEVPNFAQGEMAMISTFVALHSWTPLANLFLFPLPEPCCLPLY